MNTYTITFSSLMSEKTINADNYKDNGNFFDFYTGEDLVFSIRIDLVGHIELIK